MFIEIIVLVISFLGGLAVFGYGVYLRYLVHKRRKEKVYLIEALEGAAVSFLHVEDVKYEYHTKTELKEELCFND